jgi:EAL domain-containing protein (putative c-di-GMP-specific phosphodiesterase class I)
LKVALDDFGTGFASLTHLMTVPVDFIKIDKSFIDRLVSDRPSQIIVEGVIGIATKLGIQVIAEGIEHVEQAEMLAAMGCLAGQGYLYSRAVDTDAIAALVRRGPMLPQAAPALAQKRNRPQARACGYRCQTRAHCNRQTWRECPACAT